MITLKQARELQYGQIIYCKHYVNADGTPQRWKVNGRVKTWKRNLGRIQAPLKRGLYEYDYLTEFNLEQFSLTEEGVKQ